MALCADQLERGEDRPRLVERAGAATTRIAIDGRRSASTTTRGASSAKRSRTMNSSVPRAAERRADAAQSIQRDVVAGPVLARARDVGADAAARAAHAAEGEADHPPSRDEREDRRHSTPSTAAGTSRSMSKPGFGATLEAARAHLEARRLPAAVADLGEEARPEEDAVQEHGHEQLLDVLRRHVAALSAAPPTRARRG